MKRLFLLTIVIAVQLNGSVYQVTEESNLPNDPRELYIDLMKRCVANTIYEDPWWDWSRACQRDYDSEFRKNGMDWPMIAHTMIGSLRLNNIHNCLKEILRENIPGDCIETGVWRGGATILMKAILKAYGDTKRKVWVADSFEGLPRPNVAKYPQDKDMNLFQESHLAVPLEQVQNNFRKYDLLDKNVIFLKGFFSETLPNAPIERIALLRLDGDLYESTMDALTNLYPKLSKGGFVIIDDYVIEACRMAVTDYRAKHGIKNPMIRIDWGGIYWKKTTD